MKSGERKLAPPELSAVVAEEGSLEARWKSRNPNDRLEGKGRRREGGEGGRGGGEREGEGGRRTERDSDQEHTRHSTALVILALRSSHYSQPSDW